MNWIRLLQPCIETAIAAGDAIEACAQNIEVNQKQDESPVTNADLAADKIIAQGLESLSAVGHKYPILSEESYQDFQLPGGRYWCVDPLDGTRDFIHKTGDYTVNIALMENGQPVLGVVHAPHSGVTYYGSPDGSFSMKNNQIKENKVKTLNPEQMVALISRFHPNKELVACLESMPEIEILQRGSAIKLCAVADGSADIYPRYTPCHDWDIAAAHCVLRAAGGEIFNLDFSSFKYNHSSPWLLNGFIAVNDPSHAWLDLLSRLPKKN